MNLVKLVDKGLDRFLPSEKREPKALHAAMRYSVFPGGKRIRPRILLEVAAACGGDYRTALPAACAIELVHTYSLIHDDLPSMDDDDTRRGKPSCHKKFSEALAILAGDSLLTLAFGILASEYPPKASAKMARGLSAAIGSLGMAGGQALDVAGDKNIKNINYLKTAKLFEAAAALGAITACAGKKKLALARRYGVSIGMAFQIVDDVLDGQNDFSTKDALPFIKKAKAALKIFGSKAGELAGIATNIIVRASKRIR